MPSDNFNAPNGTLLATHNPLWVDVDATYDVASLSIFNNTVNKQSDFGNGHGALRSDGNPNISQIDFVGGASTNITRRVLVRAGGANGSGYQFYFSSHSGGNYTQVTLVNPTRFLHAVTVSIPLAPLINMRLVATQNGLDVDLEGFINNVSAITYTDTVERLSGGLPGFQAVGTSPYADAAFDNWTDTVVAPGSYSRLINKGLITPKLINAGLIS